jgi:hypothetical protein
VGALEGGIVGENDGAFEGVPVGGGGGGGWKILIAQLKNVETLSAQLVGDRVGCNVGLRVGSLVGFAVGS